MVICVINPSGLCCGFVCQVSPSTWRGSPRVSGDTDVPELLQYVCAAPEPRAVQGAAAPPAPPLFRACNYTPINCTGSSESNEKCNISILSFLFASPLPVLCGCCAHPFSSLLCHPPGEQHGILRYSQTWGSDAFDLCLPSSIPEQQHEADGQRVSPAPSPGPFSSPSLSNSLLMAWTAGQRGELKINTLKSNK